MPPKNLRLVIEDEELGRMPTSIWIAKSAFEVFEYDLQKDSVGSVGYVPDLLWGVDSDTLPKDKRTGQSWTIPAGKHLVFISANSEGTTILRANRDEKEIIKVVLPSKAAESHFRPPTPDDYKAPEFKLEAKDDEYWAVFKGKDSPAGSRAPTYSVVKIYRSKKEATDDLPRLQSENPGKRLFVNVIHDPDKLAASVFQRQAAGQWPTESKGRKGVPRRLRETGEADQDYDHETYDAIVAQLDAAGLKGATHSEFDKYQGVYLNVPGVGKFWTKDSFSTGERDSESAAKSYTNAVLIDPEGNEFSATRGDYFTLKSDHVFTGHTLRLTKSNGETVEKENPSVADFPDLGDVASTFTYKPGTQEFHLVLAPEADSDEDIEVIVDNDGTVDASQLVAYCKEHNTGRTGYYGTKMFPNSEAKKPSLDQAITATLNWADEQAEFGGMSRISELVREVMRATGIEDYKKVSDAVRKAMSKRGWQTVPYRGEAAPATTSATTPTKPAATPGVVQPKPGDEKVAKVIDLMRKDKVATDDASPNFVNDFANRRGITDLTRDQVVQISDTYVLDPKEKKPEKPAPGKTTTAGEFISKAPRVSTRLEMSAPPKFELNARVVVDPAAAFKGGPGQVIDRFGRLGEWTYKVWLDSGGKVTASEEDITAEAAPSAATESKGYSDISSCPGICMECGASGFCHVVVVEDSGGDKDELWLCDTHFREWQSKSKRGSPSGSLTEGKLAEDYKDINLDWEIGEEITSPYDSFIAHEIKSCLEANKEKLPFALPAHFDVIIPAGGSDWAAQQLYDEEKRIWDWEMSGGYEVFADVNTQIATGDFAVGGYWDENDDTVLGTTLTVLNIEEGPDGMPVESKFRVPVWLRAFVESAAKVAGANPAHLAWLLTQATYLSQDAITDLVAEWRDSGRFDFDRIRYQPSRKENEGIIDYSRVNTWKDLMQYSRWVVENHPEVRDSVATILMTVALSYNDEPGFEQYGDEEDETHNAARQINDLVANANQSTGVPETEDEDVTTAVRVFRVQAGKGMNDKDLEAAYDALAKKYGEATVNAELQKAVKEEGPAQKPVTEFAAELANAHSTNRYAGGWVSCINVLRSKGLSDQQTEAIIRSEWTRWAADNSTAPQGRATGQDLLRFIEQHDLWDEVKGLVEDDNSRDSAIEEDGDPNTPPPVKQGDHITIKLWSGDSGEVGGTLLTDPVWTPRDIGTGGVWRADVRWDKGNAVGKATPLSASRITSVNGNPVGKSEPAAPVEPSPEPFMPGAEPAIVAHEGVSTRRRVIAEEVAALRLELDGPADTLYDWAFYRVVDSLSPLSGAPTDSGENDKHVWVVVNAEDANPADMEKTLHDIGVQIEGESNGRLKFERVFRPSQVGGIIRWTKTGLGESDISAADLAREFPPDAPSPTAVAPTTIPATKNPLKVGDILSSSWGYDQTNVEFYQVVKASGASVWVAQIAAQDSGDPDSSTIVPLKDHFLPKAYPASRYGNADGVIGPRRVSPDGWIRIDKRGVIYASPWKGEPAYVTPAGMGH